MIVKGWGRFGQVLGHQLVSHDFSVRRWGVGYMIVGGGGMIVKGRDALCKCWDINSRVRIVLGEGGWVYDCRG